MTKVYGSHRDPVVVMISDVEHKLWLYAPENKRLRDDGLNVLPKFIKIGFFDP